MGSEPSPPAATLLPKTGFPGVCFGRIASHLHAASMMVRKPRFWPAERKSKSSATHTSICARRRARLMPSRLACLDDQTGVLHESPPGWRFLQPPTTSSTCGQHFDQAAWNCQISGGQLRPLHAAWAFVTVGRRCSQPGPAIWASSVGNDELAVEEIALKHCHNLSRWG